MSRRLVISSSRFVGSVAGADAETAAFSQQNFNPLQFVYHSLLESGNVAAASFSLNGGGSTHRVTFSRSYSSPPPILVFCKSPRAPYGSVQTPVLYSQGYVPNIGYGEAQLLFTYTVDTTGISMTFSGNGGGISSTWPIGRALDTFWMVLQT